MKTLPSFEALTANDDRRLLAGLAIAALHSLMKTNGIWMETLRLP